MINVSNEYRNLIADYVDNKTAPDFTAKATITLLDSMVLNITEEDIIINGFKIKDGTSGSGSFQIGGAIINESTLQLNNVEGKFKDVDFYGARVIPFVGLRLSNTTGWLKKGVFTVDNSVETGSIITLTCYDNMDKFDVPFSEVGVAFPINALSLLQSVCTYCQVPLLTSTFLNQGFTITRPIEDEAITCREIVSWIAQISGNYARCNVDGALELKWYDDHPDMLDGNSSVDIVDGNGTTDIIDGNVTDKYHHIYSLSSATVGTDDVVITGVKVKAKGDLTDYGETVLFGDTGYVIFMENPLIQENTASIVANSVGAKIVGMRFRPCNFTAIADPSREAGDIAYLTDRKQNTYPILLTNITYQIGKNDSISCDAETPSKNSSTRFSEGAKAIVEARKIARQEVSQYDLVVKQFQNLMTYGFGLYPSEEVLEDGSTIYYMHNKPTLAESSVVWKFNENGLFVSKNKGVTWAVDTNGNMLVNVLTAVGINAEWIKAGTIEGAIIAKNLTMNGGSVSINSEGQYDDKISLSYISEGGNIIRATVSPNDVVIRNLVPSNGYSLSSDLGADSIGFYERDLLLSAYTNIGMTLYSAGQTRVNINNSGDGWFANNVSALSFTDRTPHYEGDALSELYNVKGDGNGGIDHSTLPEFAQVKVPKPSSSSTKKLTAKTTKKLTAKTTNTLNAEKIHEDGEDGRDIGAMISVLTRAVQQLMDKNKEQDEQIAILKDKLESKVR